MGNNSVTKGKTRLTARILIAFMAVCLAFTAIPFLAPGSAPVAKAADVTIEGESKDQINAALAGCSEGTVVDIKLKNDIDLTDTVEDENTNVIVGIVIPSGITVNLYMNSKRILFDRPDKENTPRGAWKVKRYSVIENNGVLNIYSGIDASSPHRLSASIDSSSIVLVNNRLNMLTKKKYEEAYAYFEGIRNNGTLSVNKNVTVSISANLEYRDNNSGCDGNSTIGIADIMNTGSSQVSVNDAVLSAAAETTGWTSKDHHGDSRAFSYNIYGGQVSVSGQSELSVSSMAYSRSSSVLDKDRNADGTALAYNIASSGAITVTGGKFEYRAYCNDPEKNACKNGSQAVYTGAVISTGTPNIFDGNIGASTTEGNFGIGSDRGTQTYIETTVGKITALPLSPEGLYAETVNQSNGPSGRPTGAITAGNFYDEAGNTYQSSISTDKNNRSMSILRGTSGQGVRVHIVYRYWTNRNKTELDSSIVSTDGTLVGYSYRPLNDGTDIVKDKVHFSGIADDNYVKVPGTGLQYSSGGTTKNDYYWQIFNIAHTKASGVKWFSDADFASSTMRGNVIADFAGVNEIVAADATEPVYLFVDYVRMLPARISMSVNKNTAVYTGKPILASTLGVNIKNEMNQSDVTAEYNIDKLPNSGLIELSYSWTGTTAAGDEITGEGTLPTKVGTYQVTASFADDTQYNNNPVLHKNREAHTYTFALTITPSEVTRGTLPTSVTLTYGQKLSDVIKIAEYSADGVNGEKPEGSFSFKNPADGSGYKDVGKGTVEILWNPKTSTGDYKQTSFTVSYTVNKASLVIRPKSAAVVYGEKDFKTTFSSYFEGLVANDDNDTVKASIEKVLVYTVYINGNWYPYNAGETPAGSYIIRAVVNDSTIPSLKNYDYSIVYGVTENPEGKLSVEKRPVTIVASAESRPYAPENHSVNVSFEITEGKLTTDDLSVANTTGTLGSNNAGIQPVGGIYGDTVNALLSGGKRDNYYVEKLLYNTGNTLTVEITKATPSVALPSLGERFYRRNQTLNDIDLSGYNTAGTWQWTDGSINPTVAVGLYSARFIPTDSGNYETVVTDIALKIKPTPVTISFRGEVSYGDSIPNITAYSYTAPNDPDFSIDAVTTTGNINVSTDYTVGSTVNAEGYKVYISAPNFKDVNGNYTFSTQDGVITVKPRTIVFTVENAEITYGDNFAGDAVNVTFDENRLVGNDRPEDITSNGTAPKFTVTTTYNYMTNYNAGVYDLTATAGFTTTPNYDISIVNGKLTVKKADLKIKAKNLTVKYGSEKPNLDDEYELVGAKKGDTLANACTSGAVVFDTTYAKGAPVTSEGYSFYVDISGASFNNYNVSVENGVIVVEKADPNITTYPTAKLVYGQTLADAAFTGSVSDVDGEYVYDTPDIKPAWQEAPWNIYTATFIPADTVNYNTVKNLYILLKVDKKAITGSLAVVGNPMLNETLTVDVSGLDPNTVGTYTYVWTRDGVQVGTGTTLKLTGDDYIGKTVTVTATATGYYTGSASYTTTKIARTLTPVSTILTPDEFHNYFNIEGLTFNGSKTVVYNGLAHNVTLSLRPDVTAQARVGAITVKYNGSTTPPSAAGTYAVTIDIATPDYSNIVEIDGKTYDGDTVVYSPISNFGIGTLVIEKADYNVTVSVKDKVYDGYSTAEAVVVSETGAVTLSGGTKDDVSFKKASFTFSDPNVGSNKTVTYSDAVLAGSASANYKLVLTLENGGKASITPRNLLVKANPISREYEKDNYRVDVSFEINNASIAPTDSSASIGVNESTAFGTVDDYHAGTRRVTLSSVELTGAKKNNYTLVITNADNLTVQILKAAPSYPIPFVDDITYDGGRHLSDISLGDSRWSWEQSVNNEIPEAGYHVYTAVFTPDDTKNYATVSYEVGFTVNKAPVVVKAASFTVTYGDTEPTYYTTITGLTGSDTPKTLDGFVLLRCAYQPDSTVGTYAVTIDGRYESNNYTFTYTPGSVTVKPRTVYVTAEAVNREYETGNLKVTVNFSALSNVRPGDEGNVALAEYTVEGNIATDTAGKKTVEFILPELSGAVSHNYNLKLLNPNLTVEILKAHLPGVTLPTSAVMSYGDKLATARWTSGYEGEALGTFSMKDPMSTPKGVGTFTNVYKVVFTPFNSLNYATVEEYITLTVERAVLNLEMSITGVLSTGNKLFIVTNSIPADAPKYIVYSWYRVDKKDDDYRSGKLVSYNSSEYTLTEADEGKFLIAVAQNSADSPYIVSSQCVTGSSVEQPKMSFWQKILKWFYKMIAAIQAVFGRIK